MYSATILLVVVLAIVTSMLVRSHRRRKSADAARRSRENQERAEAILQNGGPRDASEYFFLFPNACRTCGSRHVSWNLDVDYDGARCYECFCEISCADCRAPISRDYIGWVDRGHEVPNLESQCADDARRLNESPSSPYVTAERSEMIPSAAALGLLPAAPVRSIDDLH